MGEIFKSWGDFFWRRGLSRKKKEKEESQKKKEKTEYIFFFGKLEEVGEEEISLEDIFAYSKSILASKLVPGFPKISKIAP